MMYRLTALLERAFQIPPARSRALLHTFGIITATTSFVIASTLLVAYETVFLSFSDTASLNIGAVVPQDVRAPVSVPTFVSQVLTEQRRADIRDSVADVYFPPDPAISRQQSDMALQILDYIDNIRHDVYATPQQKINDLQLLTDLKLNEVVIVQMLSMDEKTWLDVSEQINSVLERVMRGEIRDTNFESVLAQLPIQVSVRFTEEQSAAIVEVVKSLVRPNTLLNGDATAQAQEAAIADVSVRRSFERGQVILRAGEVVDESAYEALSMLGLLEPTNRRWRDIARAGLVSIIVVVVTGLYIARFKPDLYRSSRFVSLLGAIFLIALLGARLSGLYGQFYIYPTAALALIYVALVGPEVAVIGVLGLSVLIGVMQNQSLEMTLLVGIGGMMAALTLRRPERLNGYFMPGMLVAVANIAVILIFYQGEFSLASSGVNNLGELIVYSLINGVLAATIALAGLFAVTMLFNLPTGLKLVELSQPSQPLLQRLLREAPGTYQHSLQVSNLAEQAASAIGVNADLVRVAALYHDVGKMVNPAFFTENQVEGINPHDKLDDPARSAAIIIDHVTEGDRIAVQYRLPSRIRDFILEHHGTQVLYFYEQAVQRAESSEGVDKEQFTYPGPKPQTRETAILMLADSSEAAVRSRKPTKKQDIADTIQQIIDSKIQAGQLDESGLTLDDIKNIRKVFVDMLQAVFHPRINYPAQLKASSETNADASRKTLRAGSIVVAETNAPVGDSDRITAVKITSESPETEPTSANIQANEVPAIKIKVETDDEAPLREVPPLPRTGEHRAVKATENGHQAAKHNTPEEHA